MQLTQNKDGSVDLCRWAAEANAVGCKKPSGGADLAEGQCKCESGPVQLGSVMQLTQNEDRSGAADLAEAQCNSAAFGYGTTVQP